MASGNFYASRAKQRSSAKRHNKYDHQMNDMVGSQYGPGDNLENPKMYNPFLDNILDENPDLDSWSDHDNAPILNTSRKQSVTSSGETSALSQIFAAIRDQTKKLNTVLSNQDKLKEQYEELRLEMESLKSPTSSDNTPKRPRKRVVTRVLTDRINSIHASLDEQIKAEESSLSPHIKEVMSTLIKEVEKNPDNEFSNEAVSLAVKRKYESERRIWKEDSHKDMEIKHKRIKKAKYDQRKQRTFQKRKSVVTENEMKYFEMLSKDAMSDESDCSESDVIVVHKHEWRSNKLNLWMEELDKRYKRKLHEQNSCAPSLKRKIGSPSTSNPPLNTPNWAIDSKWINGKDNSLAEVTNSSDYIEEFSIDEYD